MDIKIYTHSVCLISDNPLEAEKLKKFSFTPICPRACGILPDDNIGIELTHEEFSEMFFKLVNIYNFQFNLD